MRLLKYIIAGILVGSVIVALLAMPSLRRRAEAAIRQENLTAARGEAFDAVSFTEVSITALLNGQPNALITVSADSVNWYVPQNGQLTLAMVPGFYEFCAAYENRLVKLVYEVREGQENSLALDIAAAPQAPELTFEQAQKGESKLIALDISGATELQLERNPNGMKIERHAGGFALALDGALTEYGVYPLALIAQNEYGQALAHVCVRIPRPEPPIEIYSVDDLKNIRRDLAASYVLMNDLDMSGVDDWTTLGTEEYPFTGVLDGNGYEISGFHAPQVISEGNNFSLLGFVKNGEVRNVIIREPHITPQVPAREGNITFTCAVIAAGLVNSVVENCASIGGIIAPSDNFINSICGLGGSIALGLFNSTDIICSAPNHYLPNTGGLFGVVGDFAYASYCANEGDVFGRHLTGGLAGYNANAEITRCINSGYIWGSTLVGEFPPGGIMQSTDFGAARNSYFVKGSSAVGGKAFNPGVLGILAPIEKKDLRNRSALTMLEDFDKYWAFASLDAQGPVPAGIFKRQAPAPVLPQVGDTVVLPAVEGVQYFYALDGGELTQTESLNIALKAGQTFTVYAAQQGCRDSDMISYSPQGGK